jgi:hypothetical protein
MKQQPRTPLTEPERKEIERSTVLLAEVRAGRTGTTAEHVLSMAFDRAAVSGETPFEVLHKLRRDRGN